MAAKDEPTALDEKFTSALKASKINLLAPTTLAPPCTPAVTPHATSPRPFSYDGDLSPTDFTSVLYVSSPPPYRTAFLFLACTKHKETVSKAILDPVKKVDEGECYVCLEKDTTKSVQAIATEKEAAYRTTGEELASP